MSIFGELIFIVFIHLMAMIVVPQAPWDVVVPNEMDRTEASAVQENSAKSMCSRLDRF